MIFLLSIIILLLVDRPLEIVSFSPRILHRNFLPSYTRSNAVVTKSQPVYLPDLSQPAFPVPPEEGYDLVVLGSGPGGESIATHAAKLGARVAVIEKKAAFGGPTGLSSKAVREATKRITNAIDQIGGDRRKQIRGLWKRKFPILKTAAEAWQAVESRERLRKCGCDLYIGSAELLPSFEKGVTKTIIRVCRPTGCVELESFHVCIATGSRAHQPNEVRKGVPIEFIKGLIVDATEISSITNLPKAIVIIGGGVIAVEYATVYAELGVGVTLICPENALLPFVEKDLRQSLINRMKKNHILIVHDDIKEISVINTTSTPDATPSVKVAMVPDPKRPNVQRIFTVDLLVYSGGRDANSESIGLENLNILTKKYGQIAVSII
jgi:NAD(P) transhydrogenase